MALHIEAVGFARLGHQVADVEPGRLAEPDRLHQFGHQQVGEQRRVEAARTQQDQIGVGNGFEGPGQGRRPFRDAAEANNRALGLADAGFAFDPLAVFEFGPEAHIGIGGGHHLALHRQHPAAGRDRRFQAAGDRRKGGEEQVAEAVALQAAARLEAVLEQAGEQRFFGGEGG